MAITNRNIHDAQYDFYMKSVAANAAPVTKSDSVDLPNYGVLVLDAAGAVKINTLAGDTVTLNLPAGNTGVMATRVWSTGTGAMNVTVLY